MALRYNWQPCSVSSSCACGSNNTIEHLLSFSKGGFPLIRHTEIRCLIIANMLTEVCHNVCIEPKLQPLTGEQLHNTTANTQDGARLDIFLWCAHFQPFVASNREGSLSSCYRKHEKMRRRAYAQGVREVEGAFFTPLVLSATEGMVNESPHFYNRLASLLATKWDQPYNSTMSWLHFRVSFSLLCSGIECIRGARSSYGRAHKSPPLIDLVISELSFDNIKKYVNIKFYFAINNLLS